MEPTSAQLFERYYNLYATDDFQALVQTAEREWPKWKDRKGYEFGEICRLVYVSKIKLKISVQNEVWYARALSRFALAGSIGGIARLMIPLAMRAREEYPEASLEILDEMELLSINDSQPIDPLVARITRRLLEDKRGAILYSTGLYHEARKSYERGLALALDDERGMFKVRLNMALCGYRAYQGRPERSAYIGETQEILNTLSTLPKPGYPGLVKTATENLARMRDDDLCNRSDFEVYEIR